jgi:hypothetical protein
MALAQASLQLPLHAFWERLGFRGSSAAFTLQAQDIAHILAGAVVFQRESKERLQAQLVADVVQRLDSVSASLDARGAADAIVKLSELCPREAHAVGRGLEAAPVQHFSSLPARDIAAVLTALHKLAFPRLRACAAPRAAAIKVAHMLTP